MHNVQLYEVNIVTAPLGDANVQCLEWPVKNPDFNLIKRLWDQLMGNKIKNIFSLSVTPAEFSKIFVQEL